MTHYEETKLTNLRGRNRTVTLTFSFALLTSDEELTTGETDNFGECLDEVEEDDGVVGLPPDFGAAAAAAGDFRDRSGETVEEAL